MSEVKYDWNQTTQLMNEDGNMDNGHLPRLAFIGFGEAGRAFSDGLAQQAGLAADWHGSIRAFDIKTNSEGKERAAKLASYEEAGITGCNSLADAVDAAQMVVSLVTADQAFKAASAAASVIASGTLFLDCNSCAPQTKQKSARVIEAGGGRYVDIAVMAPVYPARHCTAMLASGPSATGVAELMTALGMKVKVVSDKVGDASSVKLSRSIMIKGLEALTAECLLTAATLGVEDLVISSLNASHPGLDWDTAMPSMIERMITHGVRRSAEMDEAAYMIEACGLPGRMAWATSEWQSQMAALAGSGDISDGPSDCAATQALARVLARQTG